VFFIALLKNYVLQGHWGFTEALRAMLGGMSFKTQAISAAFSNYDHSFPKRKPRRVLF
jgi:hypothetical protein